MQSIIVFIDEDKGEIMPAGQKKKIKPGKTQIWVHEKKIKTGRKTRGKTNMRHSTEDAIERTAQHVRPHVWDCHKCNSREKKKTNWRVIGKMTNFGT